MNDRGEQAKSIFLQAVEQHAPAQWPEFLDRACRGDAGLRADVERLLQAHADMGSFHEPPRTRAEGTLGESAGETVGTVIGPYKLLEQIGEGGMGAVWMAQQQQPVKRLVALKLIKPGMDS